MATLNGSVGSRRRTRRTASEWRELVSQFERGGQSRKAFCSSQGLSLSTFDLWRRKLRGTPAQREHGSESMFVEVAQVEPTRSLSWDVELELGAGVVLRVRSSQRC